MNQSSVASQQMHARWVRPFSYLVVMLLLMLGLCTGVGMVNADDINRSDEVNQLIDKLKTIETDLKHEYLEIKTLSAYSKQLGTMKQVSDKCIQDEQKALNKADADLKQLGDVKSKESKEVVKLRNQQVAARNAIEVRLQECTALSFRIQTASDSVDAHLKKALEVRFFARGPNIFEIIALNLKSPVQEFSQSFDYTKKNSWLVTKATNTQFIWLIICGGAGVLLGLFLRTRCLPWVSHREWGMTTASNFSISTLATICHDAPYVLAILAFTTCIAVFTDDIVPTPIVTVLAYSLSFFLIARLIIRITLSPTPPGKFFIQMTPAVARKLAQRLEVLAFLMMIGYLLIDTLIWASLPDFSRSLVRTLIRILLAINIVWVLWLFQHLSSNLRRPFIRYALTLVLIVAVVGDLVGYSNLAGWLIRSVFGTLLVFGVIFTLMRLNKELFLGLEYAKTPVAQRARKILGLPAEGHLAFFFWLRVLTTLGYWFLLIWLLILVWNLSANVTQQLIGYLRDGFMVGELKIVPSRVLFALITLAILVALTSWIKGVMKSQLESSPMERGAREAMITMTGYAGILLAVVVALGMAGIDFANIALIAGALSVGIGFGLQNIVNNFISGLILLFERPIKTGDWIVVGNTEGYVKRIRIRSTQIQTFDRADVIVPNAELISGQVTNWMLSDTTGRARIPIGVAYGSDVEKVKRILLKIADDHPDVLTDGSAPAPFVLFREFADSSLNFELRCHIRNIDNRLRVISEINFAIDKAFREEGITIPFPQRDLHIYDTRNISPEANDD